MDLAGTLDFTLIVLSQVVLEVVAHAERLLSEMVHLMMAHSLETTLL